MRKAILFLSGFLLMIALQQCISAKQATIQSVSATIKPGQTGTWLSHEHILVDFIGADLIRPDRWNHDSVIKVMLPYLEDLKKLGVNYFVDATPNYLGRDVILLKKIADLTGLSLITNTGLYGAVNNKYIPSYAFEKTAEELSQMWIEEFERGIDGTLVKPGFIKISVDAADTLHPMHAKLVKAAAVTHLKTGLTIASHTGVAKGLWPQLNILKEQGVSPEAFIWVHAQSEKDPDHYLKAAEAGCWISLDGLGWELNQHVAKLVFAKENKILHRILISHDAGWFDPARPVQSIQSFDNIFLRLIPELISKGFTQSEIDLLLIKNPSRAFSIKKSKK